MVMEIGYSAETLWLAICKQMADVQREAEWLRYYTAKQGIAGIESSVQYIMESCTAILENIEHLKGEKM